MCSEGPLKQHLTAVRRTVTACFVPKFYTSVILFSSSKRLNLTTELFIETIHPIKIGLNGLRLPQNDFNYPFVTNFWFQEMKTGGGFFETGIFNDVPSDKQNHHSEGSFLRTMKHCFFENFETLQRWELWNSAAL